MFVLLSCAVAPLQAQFSAPAAQTNPAPLFRSGAELVALSVAVLDQQQRFVRGLHATDFTVLEDGVQQDVSFFAASEVPLDLIRCWIRARA
jgi:hypothetical protein